jgi:hypothetical protein
MPPTSHTSHFYMGWSIPKTLKKPAKMMELEFQDWLVVGLIVWLDLGD